MPSIDSPASPRSMRLVSEGARDQAACPPRTPCNFPLDSAQLAANNCLHPHAIHFAARKGRPNGNDDSEARLQPHRSRRQAGGGKGAGLRRVVSMPHPPRPPERVDAAARRPGHPRHDHLVRVAGRERRGGLLGLFALGLVVALPVFAVYGVLYASPADSRWHECGHGTAFKTPG